MPPISDEVVEPLPNFKKWGGIVAPPPILSAGGGLNLQPNFQKGMAWKDLNF